MVQRELLMRVQPWSGSRARGCPLSACPSGLASGSDIPVVHDSAKASTDNATDLMIPGNLRSALTFSILSCHISSQNTRLTTGFGPVGKNNILFLCKMKIIFVTLLANHSFHLNILQDQVAMIPACLLLSFLSYE